MSLSPLAIWRRHRRNLFSFGNVPSYLDGLARGRWSRYVQGFLDLTVGSDPPLVYGPGRVEWTGALEVRPHWASNRQPVDKVKAKWPQDSDRWPVGLTCSTFASAALGVLLNARAKHRQRWGYSVTTATRRPGEPYHDPRYFDPWLADRLEWLDGRRRIWSAAELPTPLPSPVCFAAQKGHEGFVLDCDRLELRHPVTGQRCFGPWTLFMDGSRSTGNVWRFSAEATLRFEPASARAERERGWASGPRPVALAALVLPEAATLPPAPELVLRHPA